VYILIAGGGKVGYHLARHFLDLGTHEVLLVEKNANRVRRLVDELGDMVMLGDASEVRTLARAGVARAGAVVAVTGDDEDNLIICQLAHHRFNVPRTLARVNNPKNEQIFKDLGIAETLSSTRLIHSLLEQEVEVGEILPVATLDRGNIEVIASELTDDSPVANRKLKDLSIPGSCIIAAIVRDGAILDPSGTMELLAGDTLVALVRTVDAPQLRALLAPAVAAST